MTRTTWPPSATNLPRQLSRIMLIWALLCTLAACGGGTPSDTQIANNGGGGVGEGGTGAPATAASIGVVTGKDDTSITVNNITFDRQAATIEDAQATPLTDADLKPGMWVAVEGYTDDSGANPLASHIRVYPAVRGEVSGVDHDKATLTVLGSTVALSADTLVEGRQGHPLAEGDTVEVHGPLGSQAGTVLASRVDKLSTPPTMAWPYQLRGKVSQLDTTLSTMKVGAQRVSYLGASVTLTSTLANGMVVRVAATKMPAKGQIWAIERLSTDHALPLNLSFLYVEGVVDQWQAGPSFWIEDLFTNATTANGRQLVTADGQRIAAIGGLRSGVLVAKSVALSTPGESPEFKLSGSISSYQSLADFKLNSVTIDASQATFTAGGASQLGKDAKVSLSGPVQGRKLVASKIKVITAAPAAAAASSASAP
jgi:hypothetical protein